jgi:glycosyltransferase involved in cell wall biosynthesis
MKNKLRLFIIEPNNGGGLIHYAYQLCTALSNEGMDVTLVTGANYEMTDFPHNFHVEKIMNLWEHFDSGSTKVESQNFIKRAWKKIYWTLRRGVRGIRWVVAWTRLTLYLLRVKPDIVQFSKFEYSFESLFVGYLRRNRVVVSQVCHEFELRESRDLISLILNRAGSEIYRHFSVIFLLSEEIRKRFLSIHTSIPEERTCVIPHGNSGWLLNIPPVSEEVLRHHYGLRENERVVLFFGLLSPSKGLDDLLDAFAIVQKSCNAKLIIAGYPTKHINMNEMLEKNRKLGIADNVIFDMRYIPLEEIQPLMGLASVVVYPYRSGTQSGALQVAYTFGKPVIATAVGGLPEAVEDGKSGFIVPPHSPSELSKRIIAFINDLKMADEMGKYARHLSETRFSWQPIAAEIAQVYDRLIESRDRFIQGEDD